MDVACKFVVARPGNRVDIEKFQLTVPPTDIIFVTMRKSNQFSFAFGRCRRDRVLTKAIVGNGMLCNNQLSYCQHV